MIPPSFLKKPALLAPTAEHFLPIQKAGEEPKKISAATLVAAASSAGAAAGTAAATAALDALNIPAMIAAAVQAATGGTAPAVTLPTMAINTESRIVIDGSIPTELATITLSGPLPGGVAPSPSPNDGRIAYSTPANVNGIWSFKVLKGLSASGIGSQKYATNLALAGATNSPQTVDFTLIVEAAPVVTPGEGRAEKMLYTHRVEGKNEPAGTVMTWGTALQEGDLLSTEQLSVRRPDGTRLDTQTDFVGADWFSSGTRYVACHFAVPVLLPSFFEEMQIWREPKPATKPASLNFAALAAAHGATNYTIFNGANVTTINALDAPDNGQQWFDGPLAVCSRKIINVARASVGGNTNTRFILDRTIYRDGSVMLDFQHENTDTYRADQGTAAYGLRLTASGAQRMNYDVPAHHLYKKFPRQIRLSPSGAVRNQYPVAIRPNLGYMSKTGFVAELDTQLGIADSVIQDMQTAMAGANWNTPLSSRDVQTYFPETGGNNVIGETTLANAAWAVSGHPVAIQYAHDQAEVYDGVPWHYWYFDKNDVVTPVNRPRSWTIKDGGFDGQTPSEDNMWTPDHAHMGDPQFLCYIFSARRSRLDSLKSQAAWSVNAAAPYDGGRGDITNAATDALTPEGEAERLAYLRSGGWKGINVHNGEQLRAHSWSIRQVQEFLCVMPPWMDPHGDYFSLVLNNTRKMIEDRRPQLKLAQGPLVFGSYERSTYGDGEGAQAPWQNMFRGCMDVRGARMKFPYAETYIVEMYQNFFFNSLMDHVSSNGTYYGSLGSGYNMQLISGESIDWLDPRNYKREWYDTVRNGRGDKYGPNFADVQQTDGDYQLRAMSLAAEIYNLFSDRGYDLTLAKKAMAVMAEWPEEKTYSTQAGFKTNPRLTAVISGTTRAGGTKFGGQLPPGATKPSPYPIVDAYPYSAPKLILNQQPTLVLGKDMPFPRKVRVLDYVGPVPSGGVVTGGFFEYLEIRKNTTNSNVLELWVRASLAGLDLNEENYRANPRLESAVNFDQISIPVDIVSGTGGAI